jgi:hypothetical protein
MAWVVLGHSFIGTASGMVRNMLDIYHRFSGYQTSLAMEAVQNALPSVDSFFLMGGTLTAYITFRELERAGGDVSRHLITFALYYVHRYLRLTLPYALVMGVVIAVLPSLAYGPSWFQVEAMAQVPFTFYLFFSISISFSSLFFSSLLLFFLLPFHPQECRTNGWKNLLYVSTLTGDWADRQGEPCMGVTWYLVDDWIFHVVSLPALYYPMHLLRQWKVGCDGTQAPPQGHKASLAYWATLTLGLTAFIFWLNWSLG